MDWMLFVAPEGMEPLGKSADGTPLAASPDGVAPMREVRPSAPLKVDLP